MNTGEDIHGLRKILDMSRAISIVLLLLDFYFHCYTAFRQWKLTATISNRILENIVKTGLFDRPVTSRLLVLLFLAISLLGTRGKKDETFSYKGGLLLGFIGLLFFWGSYGAFLLNAENREIALVYMGLSFIGYLLILSGGVRLTRVISYSLRKGFFSEDNSGFQQEERLIKTEFSLHLSATYNWKGKNRNSHINFINPRRGILIMGSPGCGKSWFIIEPIIRQLIQKGFALFVYDFKYPALTELVYNQFLYHRKKYTSSARFFCINFTDLSRSHRCNLIEPSTLGYMADAIGVSRTILLSMNKTWVHKQGEFFVESPINFLGALVWYLRKYQNGIYCTLPHAIELAQIPYEKLFTLLNTEPEIQTLIGPFIEAYKEKNIEMLGSQIASAKIPLGRLASPDLYYVLTGNDFGLDINNPEAPKLFCLGGDPPRQEALAPVLSLYIDRLNKLVNQQGKVPCALVCDEFATVRAASILTTIATARSNDIIPVLSVQDVSQLRTHYSREEADLIANITGNLVCGQVGGDTAHWISERFPDTLQYKKTVSVNSNDTSISKAELMVEAVSTSTISSLSSGEFVGIIADEPGTKVSLKTFHATIVKEPEDSRKKGWKELPIVQEVTAEMVDENFKRVKREINELIASEMKRILGDPAMAGMMVKK